METNIATKASDILVSLGLPAKQAVYAGRMGGTSTVIASVGLDLGGVQIAANLYGRLSTKDGKPSVVPDLAIPRDIKLDPLFAVTVNEAVAKACNAWPLYRRMQEKALARLAAGEKAVDTKIKLPEFDGTTEADNKPALVKPTATK